MLTLILASLVMGLTSIVSNVDNNEPTIGKKVKVFILAGQSNMEGHGQIRSLNHLGQHPQYGYLLEKLKNADGSWKEREDVIITWQAREKKSGPLTVGWGSQNHEIGPELMFGTVMGEKYDEQVLLIKTAWGGKDVFCDFRSPTAGSLTEDEALLLEREQSENNNREIGYYYRKLISEIKEQLMNIDNLVPGYQGQGYEISGMAWFQGWNDFCQWHIEIDQKKVGTGIIENYPKNLSAMFRDLRQDLNVPNMPIVIGEMGIGGYDIALRAKGQENHEAQAVMNFRQAQQAVAEDKTLRNVTFVPTAGFWDTRLQELRQISDAYWSEKQKKGISDTTENHLPTKELNDEYLNRGGHWYCHYNGSATNYSLVGYALANALITGE
ncbi:hypothetical protein CMK22_10785 [Candidatus Poribacteria bacterium]|nr:hypothetical protein [Candidatus Poribacteria bacterium]